MSTNDLRLGAGVTRGKPVPIEVDGQPLLAYEGETIAIALLAAGRRVLHTTRSHAPRGVYCNMGVCHSCLVTVDGVPNVRACVTLVAAHLKIETQHGAGTDAVSLPSREQAAGGEGHPQEEIAR
jgi:aerobic-type carbon monoxide dehydrogenase small subunit (CoxS/CutS family)